ncbi:hypothetical protein NBRC116188_21420 [Oceaniserpentilla sp. 4NH20-0058]|uniref:type I-F CRISPR-associated endoribonuclease Cas6/Csy4 n=1 Tax=Oceaniserpentilla sp. 4NH20-0058 TaxID=3127660 RepID=UPI003108AA04
MKYYLDITLLPDAESNLGFLWHKIYLQIHLALVENKVAEKDSAIATSFPKYGDKDFPLGDKLRLLAETHQQLEDLNLTTWLARYSDYVHIKAIKTVPETIAEYAYFKRYRFKSIDNLKKGVDKRAAAIAAKNGYEVNEVKTRLLASIANLDKQSKLPYINVSSLSTDKQLTEEQRRKFLLFIEQEKTPNPIGNNSLLTTYGLSRREHDKKVAVPLFEG